MTKFTINYSKNLDDMNPVKYKVIKAFVNYCVLELGIESDFNFYLFSSKDTDKPQGITLACFRTDNNDIWVRANGRIAMDINRSFAHELEHLKQKETGQLDDMSKYTDIGGEIENEANAISGQLCKKFTKAFDCKFVYDL